MVIVPPAPPTPETVKLLELVASPPGAITLIGPEVAPVGTVAEILVLEFTVNDALVPLNVTDTVPVKCVPVIVTLLPTAPLPGEKLVMLGAKAPSPCARNTAAISGATAVKNVKPVSASTTLAEVI